MHRLVAAVVLVIALDVGTASAARLECPAFRGSVVPGDVVAQTSFGAGRYDLKRADRVCRPTSGVSLGALRSHPVRGASRARNTARRQVAIERIAGLVDIDTSQPIAILLPETPGLPAYACYRLLNDLPTSRLCVLADLTGEGLLSGKALLCNRGRCRERSVLGITGDNDMYTATWDAAVTIPGIADPIEAVAVTSRVRVGRAAMDVHLDVEDTLSLDVRLRARNRWVLDGILARDATPIASASGEGRARVAYPNMSVDVDVRNDVGTVSVSMRRNREADDPRPFAGCWTFTLGTEGGVQTDVQLPLVLPLSGIGASRATTEMTGDEPVRTLDNGTCYVTPRGRLACTIPTSGGDLSLFGVLQVATPPASGTGRFAEPGRTGTWTARRCPIATAP